MVPHRELALVPFPALLSRSGSRLINKYYIAIAPSISLLAKLHNLPTRADTPSAALIIGNPKMPNLAAFGSLKQLPKAGVEANTVADILGTTAFCDEKATKEVVLKLIESAKIVHFATHGLLRIPNSKSYLLGGLVLAGSATKDTVEECILLPEEIQQLKLHGCRLVMLTCCNTGQGKVSAEGLLGIGRAFLFAGATTVILSLWEVPDTHVTLELVRNFYVNYTQNASPAESLRKAMLMAKQKAAKTNEWASYYVLGVA